MCFRSMLLGLVLVIAASGAAQAQISSADMNCDGVIDELDVAPFVDCLLRDNCVSCEPARMALVPIGEFQMGDSFTEGSTYERPVHAVFVDDFYADIYEVTNKQYSEALNWALAQGDQIVVSGDTVLQYGTGSSYPYCSTNAYYANIIWDGSVFGVAPDRGDHPVCTVTWYGAVAFCNWRSAMYGRPQCYDLSTWECNFQPGYRLPTEAEWEKAARGGTSGHRFPWSDTIEHARTNFYSNWSDGAPTYPYDLSTTSGNHPLWGTSNQYVKTCPVGFFNGDLQYKAEWNWPGEPTIYQTQSNANGYGLYDMAGNSHEWCNDMFARSYYDESPYDNPRGPSSEDRRIWRGGAWNSGTRDCRVALRGNAYPGNLDVATGFRCVVGAVPHFAVADLNCDDTVDGRDIATFVEALLTPDFRQCPPQEMVFVDAGEFQMGDTFAEGDADELPVHTVLVDDFYIDAHEVTNQQYAEALNWAWSQGDLIEVANNLVCRHGDGTSFVYCETNASFGFSRITWDGSTFGAVPGSEDHPVVRVNWYGAAAYANWRSGMEDRDLCYDTTTWDCDFSRGYRLPTEAEWEKAARGGAAGHRFPWTDSELISHDRANFYSSWSGGSPVYAFDTSPYLGVQPLWGAGASQNTNPVGFFSGAVQQKADWNWPGEPTAYQTADDSNAYGLTDMAGNVWEWCNDKYAADYYESEDYDNPHGPADGIGRVLRSGCAARDANYCRSASRNYAPTIAVRFNYVGFRCVLPRQ